jgi:hypothetical protein
MKEHFCPAEKSIITYQDKCNWCGESEGSMTQEALKLALEALENGDVPTPENVGKNLDAITAIKQALAQTQEPDDIASILACRDMLDAQPVSEVDRVIWPERTEQEPVPPPWWPAVENILTEYGLQAIDFVADFKQALAQKREPIAMLFGSLPVYDDTTPPQRTWVGLTDEERIEIDHLALSRVQAVQMTEAKLKEKNT